MPTRIVTVAPSVTPEPHFVPILGAIWTGVKVYYGTGNEKTYGFEILGGSEDCLTIARGIYVRYPSGSEEWKDRNYIIASDLFFAVSNDPALEKREWYEYSGCP